jgi:tyrosinase
VFWMHHSNIDRLWASWNRGKCKNPGAPWTGAKFVFADTKGQKVVATVGDFDDIAKLHYTYEAFEPASCPALIAKLNPVVLAALPKLTQITSGPLRVNLAPPAPQGGAKATALREQVKALAPERSVYLVLENVHAEAPVGTHYDVYLDLPAGATPSPESPNYMGTINFFAVTMSADMDNMKPRTFSIDVTDKIKALGNALAEAPTVTLVPSGQPAETANATIGEVQLVAQ